MNHQVHAINHVFGARYKWNVVKDPRHYATLVKYIYQNPVRAGLCARPEQYIYSSLRALYGFERAIIPIQSAPMGFEPGFFSDVELFLTWLNANIEENELRAVRLGVRRREFDLATTRSSRRKIALIENDALLNQK